MVIRAGKKANWKNPKHPMLSNRNKYVNVDGVSRDYVLNKEVIGIRLNANAVGIDVCKHTKVKFLLFKREYLKMVPIARVIKMKASKNPKNKSPIPNRISKLCLLKL